MATDEPVLDARAGTSVPGPSPSPESGARGSAGPARRGRVVGWGCFVLGWLVSAATVNAVFRLPEAFWADTIMWILVVVLSFAAGTYATGALRVGGYSFLGASVVAGFLALLSLTDAVWPVPTPPLLVVCDWSGAAFLFMLIACASLAWIGGTIHKKAGYTDWRGEQTVGPFLIALACGLLLLSVLVAGKNPAVAAQVVLVTFGWCFYASMRMGWLPNAKTFRGQVLYRGFFVAVLFVPFCVGAADAIPTFSTVRPFLASEARHVLPPAMAEVIEGVVRSLYSSLAMMAVSLAATVAAAVIETRTLQRLWREKHPSAEMR